MLPPDHVYRFAADADYELTEKILGADLIERLGDYADATLRRQPHAVTENYFVFQKSSIVKKDCDKASTDIPDIALTIPFTPTQQILEGRSCTIV